MIWSQHERGPADYIAETWLSLRANEVPGWVEEYFGAAMADTLRGVASIAEAAYAVPVLRQLYPFTSHYWLTFSTCTGYPYSYDLPCVRFFLGDGYVVRDRIEGNVIGVADDAEGAIGIVLAHLPADIGPARAGTADDS